MNLEWISVETRIPDKQDEYLIRWRTSQSRNTFVAICEFELTSNSGQWLLNDYIKQYKDVEVIAWMPVPEAYREDVAEESNCISCEVVTKAIDILKTERECVERQGTVACPNRDCANCDLLRLTEDVLNAYDIAIKVLYQHIIKS